MIIDEIIILIDIVHCSLGNSKNEMCAVGSTTPSEVRVKKKIK